MVILSVNNTADIYGASRSLHRTLEMFALNGHQVHLVTPKDGPLVKLMQASGIVVHVFPSLAIIDRMGFSSLRGKARFIFRYCTSVYKLCALIQQLGVDIVHTNSSVLPAPGLAARITGRPHFWHIREFFSEFPEIWNFYQRYIWIFSTRIIAISSAVQNQFKPHLREKCAIVFNGVNDSDHAVDINAAQRFREMLGKPVFLVGVVGRIKLERKGQEILIKAAALLADAQPEIHYVIVGSPAPGYEDHLIRLQELICQLGLEERFTFTGDIQLMRDIYAAFDVTVVPSVLPEPFGRVVMESMAAGTPVIGSRCGGIPEQIRDGVTGLLVKPGDEHDLAEAISTIISDEALRCSLSSAGKADVYKRFSVHSNFTQLNELFASARHPKSMILSVHNSSDIYGASRCLHRMLEVFVRDGHRVHVVLPEDGPLSELLRTSGIVVHIFPLLSVIDRANLASLSGKTKFCLQFCVSVVWLSALILILKADIVHTNTAVLPAPALATRLTRRRHLWHIREFFSEFPGIWRQYQKYMWRFSNGIITISSAVQDQFERRFQDRCTLIYDGLDEDAATVDMESSQRFRAGMDNPDFLVGVVGRIKWERKGQEILIKAAALLAETHPEARYSIVGTPAVGNESHLIRLRKLITELKLEGRVTLTGDIREVRDVYAAFDVTVVPSILPEPFGCVVMESMAAGTPVIGSRCGGIPEQIVDGVTGLLFTPGDENELARALALLMEDDALRQRLGEAGQRRFRERFGIAHSHARFVKTFERCGRGRFKDEEKQIGTLP